MLDILRNLRKSDEEKQQEALNAYLDDMLAPDQRQQVEKLLEQDASQQAELDQMRLLRQEMRQLPSRRIPRSFTLDPVLYGRPRREPLVLAYPVLRTATVLAAFFFVFALAANLFVSGAPGISSDAETVAMQIVPEREVVAEEAVEEEFTEAEAEAAEEEVGSIVTEAESVERAAGEAAVEDEAVQESAAAALLPEEKTAVPELEAAFDTADAEAAEGPTEAPNAAPIQEAEAPPEPMTTVPSDSRAEQAEPALAAEIEIPAAPASAATGVAELAELAPLATTVSRDGVERSKPEVQRQSDTSLYLTSNLRMIALLLAAVFIVLIALTLLARRRL